MNQIAANLVAAHATPGFIARSEIISKKTRRPPATQFCLLATHFEILSRRTHAQHHPIEKSRCRRHPQRPPDARPATAASAVRAGKSEIKLNRKSSNPKIP
jgi:hypothetical protein